MQNIVNNKVKVLAFGAHPDDIELGCAGLLAKLSNENVSFGMADLTRGEMGTRGTVKERAEEAAKAAQILRAQFRVNLEIPDTNIEETIENREKIVRLIRQAQPEVILLPHPGDRHPDHAQCSKFVKAAAFYAGVKKIAPEAGLPAHRPSKLLYYMISTPFEPTLFVDISETFDVKIAALRAHRSQFFNESYQAEETYISSKAYFESIETRAKYFGWQAGVAFAEPFYCEQKQLIVKISDLFQ
jgi:bacillithiol biosynthesis deacetylase BshB1